LLEDSRLQFGSWKKWKDRSLFEENMKYPGVYSVALSDHDLAGSDFSLIKEIVYFGMTNSEGGIRSRLRQFDNTIKGKEGHGGAVRVRHYMRSNNIDYETISSLLFVAVFHIKCHVNSHSPDDLRKMGLVASLEYECFARYWEQFGRWPKYNDKKLSPKK
jgi:hypothetical protein